MSDTTYQICIALLMAFIIIREVGNNNTPPPS